MYGGKRRGARTDPGETEWAKKRCPRKMKRSQAQRTARRKWCHAFQVKRENSNCAMRYRDQIKCSLKIVHWK